MLVPHQSPLRSGEEHQLLRAVAAATRNHNGPEPCIVAMLTDGRVKVIRTAAARSGDTVLRELTQRHGPAAMAYAIEPHAGPGGRTRVRDLVSSRGWVQFEGLWEPENQLNQSRRASGLSRNAAIFAGSLGMTMGALP